MSEQNSGDLDLSQKPLASLTPTPLKRAVSIVVLLLLGGMLVYLAMARPPQSILLQGYLLALGVLVLWLGETMRRATALGLVLFSDRLEDSSGRLICRVDDMAGVERGTFAFKPSNGFVIRTHSRGARHWAPGLWWQMGRRIGVGGVTPAGPAKFMAEMIAAMVAERGEL